MKPTLYQNRFHWVSSHIAHYLKDHQNVEKHLLLKMVNFDPLAPAINFSHVFSYGHYHIHNFVCPPHGNIIHFTYRQHFQHTFPPVHALFGQTTSTALSVFQLVKYSHSLHMIESVDALTHALHLELFSGRVAPCSTSWNFFLLASSRCSGDSISSVNSVWFNRKWFLHTASYFITSYLVYRMITWVGIGLHLWQMR